MVNYIFLNLLTQDQSKNIDFLVHILHRFIEFSSSSPPFALLQGDSFKAIEKDFIKEDFHLALKAWEQTTHRLLQFTFSNCFENPIYLNLIQTWKKIRKYRQIFFSTFDRFPCLTSIFYAQMPSRINSKSRCWTWSDDGYAVMTTTLIAVKVFMAHRSCA